MSNINITKISGDDIVTIESNGEKPLTVRLPFAAIDKREYDKLRSENERLKLEIEKSDALAAKWQTDWAASDEENRRFQKAIDDLTMGYPFEWAYTILKKECDHIPMKPYGSKNWKCFTCGKKLKQKWEACK